jgi:hypothetical protein
LYAAKPLQRRHNTASPMVVGAATLACTMRPR